MIVGTGVSKLLMWRMARSGGFAAIFEKKKKKRSKIISLQDSNAIVTTDVQKAEILNNCHFLPPHLKQLITHRNQVRKAWQLFRYPPERLYNQIQAHLRRQFKIYNDNTWENKLASLTTEDNSLWITTSRFKKKRTKIPALTNTNLPLNKALTDEQKADTLANSYETQFSEK
ncbi:hypothetical protein CEXT_235691 [Caerostris extrusa]|uniref:Uncharacterized protein n=1 Tax=Caerostris extrusa TaxID=172846 RepID=A0AAV4N7P8_CAEEX|nr:hypothetical protein CEXT_235691 [Caerostris extrusa]